MPPRGCLSPPRTCSPHTLSCCPCPRMRRSRTAHAPSSSPRATACSEICGWTDPALGLNFTTTFLGRPLDVCVPMQRDTCALLYAQPRPGPCSSVRAVRPGGRTDGARQRQRDSPFAVPLYCFQSGPQQSATAQRHLDLCLCLEPVLANVQLLWELVLCSSPILVVRARLGCVSCLCCCFFFAPFHLF